MPNPKLLELFKQDTYSDLIGERLEAVEPGYCRVSVVVTNKSMLNFHGTMHGGILFALTAHRFQRPELAGSRIKVLAIHAPA